MNEMNATDLSRNEVNEYLLKNVEMDQDLDDICRLPETVERVSEATQTLLCEEIAIDSSDIEETGINNEMDLIFNDPTDNIVNGREFNSNENLFLDSTEFQPQGKLLSEYLKNESKTKIDYNATTILKSTQPLGSGGYSGWFDSTGFHIEMANDSALYFYVPEIKSESKQMEFPSLDPQTLVIYNQPVSSLASFDLPSARDLLTTSINKASSSLRSISSDDDISSDEFSVVFQPSEFKPSSKIYKKRMSFHTNISS